MALKKTITTIAGIEVKDAYHRVCQVRLDSKAVLVFNVSMHKDAENPSFFSAGHACAYDMAGENPMKQAYDYLKTLPQYDGAQDC
jgi:hypothetical protein